MWIHLLRFKIRSMKYSNISLTEDKIFVKTEYLTKMGFSLIMNIVDLVVFNALAHSNHARDTFPCYVWVRAQTGHIFFSFRNELY